MSLAGGLKSSQMVYFPTERKCVVAHLMLLVFSEIKSLRSCVPFQSAWLIVCMCLHVHTDRPVWNRIIVCFRLKGSSCLFCSVFSSCLLCDRDWEKLCLGAVGGLTMTGVMRPFKTTFLQRHSTWMTSFSTLQQQRWWKIPKIFYLWQCEGKRFCTTEQLILRCVICAEPYKYTTPSKAKLSIYVSSVFLFVH